MTNTGDTDRLLVLGRYGEKDLERMFEEAGVLAAIAKRGFSGIHVSIDGSEGALVHMRLVGAKSGHSHLLLDACLTEVRLETWPGRGGVRVAGDAADMIVVYWLREQDPTAAFDAKHARLPSQEHPGLGVLRRAFQVALRIAGELGKDGIAALPKFFHDAAIFYRSRLFLFLDPREQGRFEALLRDLGALSLPDESLALVGDAVRDADGAPVHWLPGFQVMPLSPLLTDYFHSEPYQAACSASFESSRFVIDAAALGAARTIFETSLAGKGATRESAKV